MGFFSNKPPRTTVKNLLDIPHLEKVLFWFLKNDPFFKTLKRDRCHSIFFQKGYGQNILENADIIFQKEPAENKNIFRYLVIILWLDLVEITKSMQESRNKNSLVKDIFAEKIHSIGKKSDETIKEFFSIAKKNGIDPDSFKEKDILSMSLLDSTKFKSCFVKDTLLSSEMRLLAWIYQDLFGEEFKTTER